MKEQFERLLAHAEWANHRALDSVESASSSGDAQKLLAHVLAGERVWLTRLQGKDSDHLGIFPEWTLAECRSWIEENAAGLREFLTAADAAELGRVVSYRDSRGGAHADTVADILTHLWMHGSYHRGQIARELRLAGSEPVATDFIVWARSTAD